ncbi:Hypothetical protein, putative [Bodo saltans]|uniref:Uncharacterized protein n=1 Tax=Bodo saltans TaxID=75058 RepID=A0A0S4IPQ4_BODSA|nr:Hypothetical protein, putative [Bodo saltans]|eukprot:CUF12017.1 Hypothetical protein, putative [Bodo saltans]
MSVQSQLRLGSFTSKRTEESLDHPVDESIDALAYSVAWHTLASSITHFSEDVGQEAAREQIPRLVASRGASFEETLRFCRSLLGGLYDLTIDAIKARQVAAAAAAEDSSRSAAAIEEWRVQRAALKILVEASLDVTGMLSSRRDAVAPSSAASSPVHPPPTPSKVALNAITSPRKPSAPNNSSSSNRSQSTTTTTNNLEESSWMAAPPPSTTGSTSMAKLCTPHTLINLLMCAYLDSMVSLVLTDVLGDAGTQEGKARAKEGKNNCSCGR